MNRLLQFLRRLFKPQDVPGPAAPASVAPEPAPVPAPPPPPSRERLFSYEKLPPGTRRPPAVFVTDPIPRASLLPEETEIPVPGKPWEADDPEEVVIRPDGTLRAEEMAVQDKFSAYRAPQEEFVPVTEEEMLWEREEEHESGDEPAPAPPAATQMAFDFGLPQQDPAK